ncbi:hypothetical protein Ciccas_008805 [Cichlidogyrus casuarinus]|uniref:Uncharacterized protein n=1 Tax=Cichlidogyrus casuarinus TaxID=1844966 RepID=A0ABD2PYW6_9PLAT
MSYSNVSDLFDHLVDCSVNFLTFRAIIPQETAISQFDFHKEELVWKSLDYSPLIQTFLI